MTYNKVTFVFKKIWVATGGNSNKAPLIKKNEFKFWSKQQQSRSTK
jgi:hypothetical protein